MIFCPFVIAIYIGSHLKDHVNPGYLFLRWTEIQTKRGEKETAKVDTEKDMEGVKERGRQVGGGEGGRMTGRNTKGDCMERESEKR